MPSQSEGSKGGGGIILSGGQRETKPKKGGGGSCFSGGWKVSILNRSKTYHRQSLDWGGELGKREEALAYMGQWYLKKRGRRGGKKYFCLTVYGP